MRYNMLEDMYFTPETLRDLQRENAKLKQDLAEALRALRASHEESVGIVTKHLDERHSIHQTVSAPLVGKIQDLEEQLATAQERIAHLQSIVEQYVSGKGPAVAAIRGLRTYKKLATNYFLRRSL